MPKAPKCTPDLSAQPTTTQAPPSSSKAIEWRRVIFNLILIAALTTTIILLAKPSFNYSTHTPPRPSSLAIVSVTSDEYFVNTWIESREPWEVGDPVSILFTVRLFVEIDGENVDKVTEPPAAAANGKSASFILVDSLATSLTSCSTHVNGAIAADTIQFDNLTTNERDAVTDWMLGRPLPSSSIRDQDDEDARSATARELTFRRLTPTEPVPVVIPNNDNQSLPAIQYEFDCTFSPDAFWQIGGSSETFIFPEVRSVFLSSKEGGARHRLYRDLYIKNSVGDRYELAESTIEPAYNEVGHLKFFSSDKSDAGDTAQLAPFESTFSDLQHQNMESILLFIAGILVGILSSILVKGIYAIADRWLI